MSTNVSSGFSRRSFLKLAAATSAIGVLSACVAPVPGQPGAVPGSQGGAAVRILLPSWATAEMPFDTAAREFNEANPGSNVVIQTTGEGWDTKVMSQIASDTLEWSGVGIASSASSSLPTWILTGMIQPLDDMISASKVEGSSKMLDDMIPVLRDASTHEGKFYGIPYSFENISFNWRTDYFDAVGATEAPANWDDWLEIAKEVKKWGADQQIYATSFIPDLDASTGTLIYGSTKEPFDDDMLLKWESDEGVGALAFYRKLVLEEELTPPHGFDGWEDAYFAGKLASVQAQSSRGVWGQTTFGTDKVTTSPVPALVPDNAGTPFWGNCVGVLNKAPNAQTALDYFVYAMGPQNLTFQKTAINTGKTPVYQSIYDDVINGDPQFGIYAWMNDMRAQVEKSVIRPFNNYFSIQDGAYRKHIVELVEPGSTMTPEECAKAIVEDARAEIAKQKA